MLKRLALSMVSLATITLFVGNADAHTWFTLKPPGAGNFDWYNQTEPNFAVASDGIGASGGKYIQINGQNTSTAGHCYELETTPRTTSNPDTRIWVFDGTNWRSVNDDFGGTLQSKARIWIATGGGVALDFLVRVEAFSAAYNSMDFYFKYTRRDITEAACTTGQTTIPWAKMKTSSGTNNWGTVTLSPNAS
jgi:hypothetical protein